MRIVIQCAGSKIAMARPFKDETGFPLRFVAHPDLTHPGPQQVRPDDLIKPGSSATWRDLLIEYNDLGEANEENHTNSFGLSMAGDLYEPRAYGSLVRVFGYENVYILSAGWGLVRASYWLPTYDITFSSAKDVPAYARRRMTEDGWKDFNHLLEDWQDGEIEPKEEIVFFGGQSYLPLYVDLARGIPCQKLIYQKSATPEIEGFTIRRYAGKTSTNWHYAAIRDFMGEDF